MIEHPTNDRERIIVPLDTTDRHQLQDLVAALNGKIGMFKVGNELFTAHGPDAIAWIRAEGARVFLDLKYHDIPNTVAGAVRAAVGLGVSMLTVHASGGSLMLEKAVATATESDHQVCVVAVTILTSLDHTEIKRIGFDNDPLNTVVRLGGLAVNTGVHGLVCSPGEVGALRSYLGDTPILVTPGLRPTGSSLDDQARTATPGQAAKDGADFLVIGRPITKSNDPVSAVEDILTDLSSQSAE